MIDTTFLCIQISKKVLEITAMLLINERPIGRFHIPSLHCNCMPLTTFKSLVANMFEFAPNIMECNVFHHIHAKMKMIEPLSKRYFKTEKFCFFSELQNQEYTTFCCSLHTIKRKACLTYLTSI